jgi:hypothetical protein
MIDQSLVHERKRKNKAYSGDDDVNVLALLSEQCHFRFNEFLRHDFRVATSGIAVLLDVNLNKLRTEGLHLLPSG